MTTKTQVLLLICGICGSSASRVLRNISY
jgi:hypothetical protein